jgi:predicted NACHT family NTPase
MAGQSPSKPAELSDLVPSGGWLLALFLAIWISKQFFGKLLEELGSRLAGRVPRILQRQSITRGAIQRYRSMLPRTYGKHSLGFREDRAFDVANTHIPLQYQDQNGKRQDIQQALANQDRAVVVGEPGAGKSLLMKYIATSWAGGKWKDQSRIPVIVDLHRCGGAASILELIRSELERNGVPRSDDSVRKAMRSGKFIVLLDGLDEVPTRSRSDVSNSIRDLVRVYGQCT